jgi:hypothetical protein
MLFKSNFGYSLKIKHQIIENEKDKRILYQSLLWLPKALWQIWGLYMLVEIANGSGLLTILEI